MREVAMFVDVPLQDPIKGEGDGALRLPEWLRLTCRLCFGDDCSFAGNSVKAPAVLARDECGCE